MIILIYLILIPDGWMVLYVQSCACCDCNSSCHGKRKSVESKESHGDHKEIEHGLENRLSGLPISSNILKYRTSKKRKRTPKDGWNLWCNFYVCNSCPHPYQRLLLHTGHSLTPMGQKLIFPISHNVPCTYMNHMWLGQFCDILPICILYFPWFYTSISE